MYEYVPLPAMGERTRCFLSPQHQRVCTLNQQSKGMQLNSAPLRHLERTEGCLLYTHTETDYTNKLKSPSAPIDINLFANK